MLRRIPTAVVVILICVLANSVGAFTYNLEGWKDFKFGQPWQNSKQALENRCLSVERWGKGDIQGRSCGEWLGLQVDVRIIADEGGWFGIGKKLRGINIQTEFSDYSGNTLLRFLNDEFDMTRDYNCYHKQADSHRCTIIFKNGQVIFEDNLLNGNRRLVVALNHKELYAPGTFD